jgi:hypothetical protein
MIVTSDQIFVLLSVANDGAKNLQADQLADLLELVGADLVDVAGDHYNLTGRGRQILEETSRRERV